MMPGSGESGSENAHAPQESGGEFRALEQSSSDSKIQERPLMEFPEVAENVPNKEYYDKYFLPARNKLIADSRQNEKLNFKMVEAVKDKQMFDAVKFAELENFFIRHCLNLSDRDISDLVSQFNENFTRWYFQNRDSINLDRQIDEKVAKGEYLLAPEGIQSVIQFIKARQKLASLESDFKHSFFFNSDLDARWKIDLIELIKPKQETAGMIEQMNLIQVKTGAISEQEADEYIQSHKDWLIERVVDMEKLESLYFDKNGNQIEAKERILSDMGKMGEIFLDVCTCGTSNEIEQLMQDLDWQDLNDRQKGWLLWKNSKALIQALETAKNSGELDDFYFDLISEKITTASNAFAQKARLFRLESVNQINSIVARKSAIVSQIEIQSSLTPDARKKLLKH